MSLFDEFEEFRRKLLHRMYRRLREADEIFSSMFRGFRGFGEDLESLLESRLREFKHSTLEPIVSFNEEGDRLVILIDLPGVKKDSVNVMILEDRLEVSARVEEKVVRRALGSLSERFTFTEYRGVYGLPVPVDPKTAKVRMRGSTLVVEVEKKARD
ncbi:MAG: Hsp20/alpha crystallin family protein [Aeropyrum sp.]|nr:Hsp20/alpha crystallin family protein [Aeropyrum sp.]